MSPDDRAVRTKEAESFLDALYGRKESERLLIQTWSKLTKKSAYSSTVKDAAAKAIAVQEDAYVSVSLVAKDLGPKRRGTAKDAVGIAGFWADIDVNGGPENKKNAAPDFDAAFAVANEVLIPTLTVCSGYGLQAWWLFEEPWIFATEDERARAGQLSAGWIARLRTEAQKNGFTIDATQDLARLMRVPGTVNTKGNQRADVTGYIDPIFEQDGPRFALETIAEHAEKVAIPSGTPGADVDINIDPDAAPPFGKLEALRENNPAFEATWKRERPDKPSWSASEFCLSIASFCVHAGFSNQEIANTITAYRIKHSDEPKHAKFYELTIRKARSTVKTERREEQREEAVEELVEIGEDDASADPDRIASLFSEMIGGGFKVKELVQSNDDPDTAIFRLILESGDVIKLGNFDNLDDPNRFAKRFAIVTGYRPKLCKKGDWIKALNALLKIRTIRDAEVTSVRSQVLNALRQYVEATLTPDHNEAAARRDPFIMPDGHLWIAPKSLHDYMNRQLRLRIAFGDLEEALDLLGFEKRVKNYRDPDAPSGQSTTREYYRAHEAVLEEATESAVEDES